jgi:malate synthase
LLRSGDEKKVMPGLPPTSNVLVCGLMRGKAQIGGGMRAMPDLMAGYAGAEKPLLRKLAPIVWCYLTAATPYAALPPGAGVDAKELAIDANAARDGYPERPVDHSVTATPDWSTAEKQQELDNNAQASCWQSALIEGRTGSAWHPANIALMEECHIAHFQPAHGQLAGTTAW